MTWRAMGGLHDRDRPIIPIGRSCMVEAIENELESHSASQVGLIFPELLFDSHLIVLHAAIQELWRIR